ncbi:hypothetical protein K0M31_008556 [Melipona bicolor]|uniref:Uncharacterized protein n=1 Tax=Melipona bicolor TaxID=60889 RepID=A0AA40FRJ8_9HYME|nr:hypothetical protein K0M31_008556 [Melipona bicolor]
MRAGTRADPGDDVVRRVFDGGAAVADTGVDAPCETTRRWVAIVTEVAAAAAAAAAATGSSSGGGSCGGGSGGGGGGGPRGGGCATSPVSMPVAVSYPPRSPVSELEISLPRER